jgi:hypothetical protein
LRTRQANSCLAQSTTQSRNIWGWIVRAADPRSATVRQKDRAPGRAVAAEAEICRQQAAPCRNKWDSSYPWVLGVLRKLAATLSPLDDRILVPALGLTGLLAKAHTRGGQYQFERACPLAAFSEIVQDPIRRIGEEEGCNRGGQAFKHGPRSQFELLRVFPAKISAPF